MLRSLERILTMNKSTGNYDSGRASVNEMEQIQKGLEEFLQQELRQMQSEGEQKKAEPQLFTIGEEENQEKELDIIGGSDRSVSPGGRGYREEDYLEDWDSPVSRGSSAHRQSTSGKSTHRQGVNRRSVHGEGTHRQNTPEQSASEKRARAASLDRAGKKKTSGRQRQNKQEEVSGRAVKQEGGRARKQKRKKSKFKRFLTAVVLLLVLLGAGLYAIVGAAYTKLHYEEAEALSAAPLKEKGVVNLLLIGNDSRENGEDGRSDAMILLSISDKTKKIYMTSLLRDMYVEIPGHKGNRLNAAYSFGGAELLLETVEQNFDIPVNDYVLVNFEAFANLVDAVGGVELELSSEEIEYVNGYLVEYNMLTNRPQGTDNMDTSVSGLVHLNGPQALAYSRNRYLGTDFGRTERQRKVLSAVMQKLPKALLTNPAELINGLLPNLTTNLTKQECLRLSLMAPKLLSYEIVQTSIPLEGTYSNVTIREMSVLQVDFEANKKYLQENIYGVAAD